RRLRERRPEDLRRAGLGTHASLPPPSRADRLEPGAPVPGLDGLAPHRSRPQQAGAAAQALGAEPLVAVYASTLIRARDTAAAIAAPHGLPVHEDPDFREMAFGAWEGLT